MFVVDTNVLVYAADVSAPEHARCRAHVERWRIHAAVLAEVMSEVPMISGNLWHDAETAVLMREHGIRRICTRDSDFARFPFVEVVDPLTAEP